MSLFTSLRYRWERHQYHLGTYESIPPFPSFEEWERKRRPMTPESMARIQREVAEANAREDRLFDEYLALSDRPKKTKWMRMIETSEPELHHDCLDMDDWHKWRAKRMAESNTVHLSDGR